MKHGKPITRRIVAIAFGMLFLGALIVASAIYFTSNVRSDAPSDALAYLNRATVASNQATTEAMDQADEDAQATARAIVLSSPYSNTKVLYPSPPPDSPGDIATEEAESIPVPTGVSALQVDPVGFNALYDFSSNMWLGYINGNTIGVLAGLKLDDPGGAAVLNPPGQGMILVGVNTESDRQDKEYLTPRRAGEVEITASEGTCLTLSTITDQGTPTGTTFYFDVATMQWSCSKKP